MVDDVWRSIPVTGQIRLVAQFPGQNLVALHAVARARLARLRARMLQPDPVQQDLRAAIERRDAAAQEWAAREAVLAAGQAELHDIQACFREVDATGMLVAPVWMADAYRRVTLVGEALLHWQACAGARLDRLAQAVLALEEAHPTLRAEVAAARAARIAALSRKLTEQAGFSWHEPPGAGSDICPPALRAATLEASAAPDRKVLLHWRQDGTNGMEWLRWQSEQGGRREDGSVAGEHAVSEALLPLVLAA